MLEIPHLEPVQIEYLSRKKTMNATCNPDVTILLTWRLVRQIHQGIRHAKKPRADILTDKGDRHVSILINGRETESPSPLKLYCLYSKYQRREKSPKLGRHSTQSPRNNMRINSRMQPCGPY